MTKAILLFLSGAATVVVLNIAQSFFRDIPPSELASAESTAATQATMERLKPHLVDFATADTAKKRNLLNEYFYQPKIDEARQLYPVTERQQNFAGIYTEIFEPAQGVAEKNQSRVLINLHGGGFSMGARTEGQLESIPVASVAGIRVVSVDYRQGPEHFFPAASEDVAAVYQALLSEYSPQQIGIFGCSAGGLLTAQVVAWLDKYELPQPGAIGIFCAGAGEFMVGDASLISETLGTRLGGDDEIAYFKEAQWSDPLVAPIGHANLLAKFPPSLIITSTRDLALSSAVATHQRLIGAGATSELHVYEGLNHYFFADTGLPESRQVFAVIAKFFDTHLAP